MNAPNILGIIGSVVILVVLFELLRRRHLREKYAVLWAAVAFGVLVLTIAPWVLNTAARLVGVDVPANLLFFVASMVLMVLTLQHSYELGRLEDKTRTLAEEIALLRLEQDSIRRAADTGSQDDMSSTEGSETP
ncbi:DUF2304 family protein [Nocardioides flavescens]|uniref:DUF2304 family protein n=1 Tax=Nocardioides flavescens TaxID=2691959 RepID=A0A6L7F0W0_9ACTN|nr:DUF2304 family protein [Nocardioides flavescens]